MMFGYVVVNKPEMKIKDFNEYQSYYCGLCKVLKDNYGRAGQMTLTYDMTFLVILLTSLYEADSTEAYHRCIAHPGPKHRMLFNEYTRYAADMNILLAYYNCIDDWNDEKNYLKLAEATLLRRKCEKIKKQYPRQWQAVCRYLKLLRDCELTGEKNLDKVSGYTGDMLGELFVMKEDMWEEILRRMGFFLGKYIYLLDAYEDLETDKKKGNYNPFLQDFNEDSFDAYCYRILNMMMADCSKEFEKLPIINNIDILRNILYSGVWEKYHIIRNDRIKK